jgi:hypothetical protein
MALTHAKATTEAEALGFLAEDFLDVYDNLVGLLAHNSGLSIDWGAATKPDYLEEDASGNLAGLPITRQQVANAIGSLAAIQTLMGNGHLGNLNLVARPVGKR